jgi:hypothetical protein
MLREEKAGFQEKFFKAASNGTIVIRIFVILGVPWVFELISTVISHYHDECQPTSVRVIVFITDLFVCFAVSSIHPIYPCHHIHPIHPILYSQFTYQFSTLLCYISLLTG